jgi:hypothetical protein
MAKQKQPAGPPMTLGNMRDLGVKRLIASCLNDACRHVALIDVSSYPAERRGHGLHCSFGLIFARNARTSAIMRLCAIERSPALTLSALATLSFKRC